MALSSTAQLLLRDATRSWNAGTQQPVALTYGFDAEGGGFESHSGDGITLFNDVQKAAIRQALDAWASISGIHFVEAQDNEGGEGIALRFRMADLGEYGFQASSPRTGGDISLDAGNFAGSAMAPGSAAYGTLLLTIGYALGFNHVSASLFAETVMAEPSGQPASTALGAADVEAVQYTYGTQAAEDALHLRWSWDNDHHALLHEGDDTSQAITGSNERDIILGHGGDDALQGLGGQDILDAGGGTNTVDGGAGIDTLRTSLFRSEATLSDLRQVTEASLDLGTYASLRGTLSGPGETTSFTGIETIAFADGRLVTDVSDPAMQVARLYWAALDRAPDSIGREWWTAALEHGQPLSSLATQFVASPEFQARFGAPDHTSFVTRVYENTLGREPDADGLSYWTNRLEGGMSRGELLAGFSESVEFIQRIAPSFLNGLWDAKDTAMQAARLYEAVLGRSPDVEGLRYWAGQLDHGLSVAQAGQAFTDSDEFRARFGAGADADFVRVVYANTLGRVPDAEGFSYWVDSLAHGMNRGELVARFSESPEFTAQHVGLLEHGVIFA